MKNDYVKPKYNTLEFTCCKCNKFCLHESISFEISTSKKVYSLYNHDLFDYQNEYIWQNKDSIIVDGKKPLIKILFKKHMMLYMINLFLIYLLLLGYVQNVVIDVTEK